MKHPDKIKISREKGKGRKNAQAKEYYKANKETLLAKGRKWYRANPERRREYRRINRDRKRGVRLKREFGLSLEEYDNLLKTQNGVCVICHKPETTRNQGGLRPLSVDHDHKTGRVRGLLCNKCNRGLGYFYDDSDLLINALAYITRNNKETCLL
jgi:hypothetical protein